MACFHVALFVCELQLLYSVLYYSRLTYSPGVTILKYTILCYLLEFSGYNCNKKVKVTGKLIRVLCIVYILGDSYQYFLLVFI